MFVEFFSPILVPAHYRTLSVPLPFLILIFPLVGFISFFSPLTLNSPTLRLHTNHFSFNTPLRLAGTILWKTSTALYYNDHRNILSCIWNLIEEKWLYVQLCSLRKIPYCAFKAHKWENIDEKQNKNILFSKTAKLMLLEVGQKNYWNPTFSQMS